MSQETVLLYGADQSLGKRLLYYLEHFALEANKALTIAVGRDPRDMEQVQEDLWQTYASRDGTGRPTMVINAYGSSDLLRLERDPQWGFTENTIPAANIALAARGAGIPMVQFSTDHVFRGKNGPYTTEDEPHPINMFGVTNYYAEEAVKSYYPVEWRGDQIPRGATIIRLSTLYGPEIESIPQVALGHPEQIQRVARDVTFSPSFIGEVAFLFARNLLQSPQALARQIIHLSANAAPTNWYDLLNPSGVKLTIENQGDLPKDGVRIGKRLGLKPTLGWVLSSDYQKGVKEFVVEQQQGQWVKYW